MSIGNHKVTQLSSAQPVPADSSGGGGGGTDDRLARVESRLAALEAHLQHLATKEDIQAMQNSMLKWCAGILITAIGTIAVIVIRLTGNG